MHKALRKMLLLHGHPNQCYHCGKKLDEMTLEHLCSRSCGGNYKASNLRIACAPCNNHRANCCTTRDCHHKWPLHTSDVAWIHRKHRDTCPISYPQV